MSGGQEKEHTIGSKKVAWNGVEFSTPAEWTPVNIKKTYLFFEKNHLPAMEIKWFRDTKISSSKALERLDSEFSKLKSPPVQIPAPFPWRSHLNSYDHQAFSWSDNSNQGVGVALHCSHCQTTTLMQFFPNPHEASAVDAGLQLLASYQDHTNSNRWSLLDFKAQLPPIYGLDSFCFEAGRLTINYISNNKKISLHRFSVAKEILKEKTLDQIANDLFAEGSPSLPFTVNDSDACQWSSTKNSFFSKLSARLTRKPVATWGRIWHDKKNDKLLALYATGRTLDHHELSSISSSFSVT